MAVLESGDAARAKPLLERSAVELSSPTGRGRALLMLGEGERALGETELAQRHFEQAISIAADEGDRHLEAAATQSVGDLYFERGSMADAASRYRHSIELLQGLESRRMVASANAGLAAAAAAKEDCERAGFLWGALDALRTASGYELLSQSRELYEQTLAPAAARSSTPPSRPAES